jgi:D-3-phosphoglycerate dehydrogenase / 2-oxoglutarate reductase
MIRILNAESLDYSNNARLILQSMGTLDEYEQLTRTELLSCLADYDVLIVRLNFQVDREVLDAGKQLKAIVSATTGLDHIDVEYARQQKIEVLSLRGQTGFLRTIPATVEHTWALLLALTRRIPWAFQSVLNGRWVRDEFKGHDLANRRLGIVGLGRIGEKVARLGMAFDMHVAAYDPYRIDWVKGVEKHNRLTDLLQGCNILSLHVALNSETQRMIGRKELATLPDGALLINTARGGVIDEVALIEALLDCKLAGAALDVVDHEREQQTRLNSVLFEYATQHDNLIITPHIGGATHESMAMTEVFMVRQLRNFLAVS